MWTSHRTLLNAINVHSIIHVAYKSHYEALNVPKTASHKEIKDAYYRLSMIYHPDKNKGSEEAAKIFRDISKAYEVLGNVRQRRLYDHGEDINQKTSQYNQPFETMNSNNDNNTTNVRNREKTFEFSKTLYSNVFDEHNFNRQKVTRDKMNKDYANRQHTYSFITITFGVSIFVMFSVFDFRNMLIDEHDHIKKKFETNNK